ncbi:MAG: L-2-amino-thiazoline-4-carboxylic acid hydrolase [Anaerolineae bacterium]
MKQVVVKLVVVGLRPFLTKAMRTTLRDTLPADQLTPPIRAAWQHYDALARELPAEPTLGASIMTRLAAMTTAVYQSLRQAGLPEAAAREKTAQVTWAVYQKVAMPPWWLTRLLARDRLARVRRAMGWFMRFPYAAPGYQMQFVPAGKDTVAFDVHRCPAADYFKKQGLPELCVSAFCNLDYPLADKWGVTLERPQTLAGGAAFCDFRFRQLPRKEKQADE